MRQGNDGQGNGTRQTGAGIFLLPIPLPIVPLPDPVPVQKILAARDNSDGLQCRGFLTGDLCVLPVSAVPPGVSFGCGFAALGPFVVELNRYEK